MSSLVQLVINEQQKMYVRLRTWIMLIILILSVIFFGVMFKYVIDMKVSDVLSFMELATNLTSLVFIFTIIVAGDIVASEFSWGTIKLLLIRPASRSKILLSKYIAIVLFMLLLLLVMLVVSYFTGLILFGMKGSTLLTATFPEVLSKYGLESIQILMAATMAFMISTVFRSSSLAIGLSIFLMFTANSIVVVLASLRYTWVKYLLFANTDLTPYFSGGRPIVPDMTLGFSISIIAAHWVLFYAVAWLIFTRRDVAGS